MNKYTKPNWKRSILITIDTQNDFTMPDSPYSIEGTEGVLPEMHKLLELFRKKGLPILHVVRLYKEDGSNVDMCRKELIESGVRIVTPGSIGAELVKEIQPEGYAGINQEELLNGGFQLISENEWVMYKSRWGAFYKTRLEDFLHDKNIDTLLFTGCNFPNCPRTSMYEASERDFKIAFAYDAMSKVYEKGINEMENIGVYVCKTSDLIRELSDI